MYYSGNLLKRYLSLATASETIAQELTLKTCEIEEHIERKLPEQLVIGRVTSVEEHPDADKLVVCQVDCGPQGNWQICTGGENVVADSYVPVALPGCHLPAINLTIESRTLRGVESNGMICSKEEVGIPEDLEEHRIWTLQYSDQTNLSTVDQSPDFDDISDNDLGIPLADKYPWLENRILDVENKTITHRPDLFGHFGLSIELHSIFGVTDTSFANGKKHMEQMMHGSIMEMLSNANQATTQVSVPSDQTYAYVLLELEEVTVRASDLYQRLVLHDLGLQPKNNRIDFSNLFTYLTGQPVHFFDADKLTGDITVRQANEGEEFTDLFDKTHTLSTNDIVICDEKEIVALAGVIGGKNTGVTESTSRILVEIGNFDPVAIRKTGTRLGLRTDAELRFEKHINPLFSLHAVEMFLDELNYFQKSLGDYTLQGLTRWVNDHASIQVKQQVEIDIDHIQQTIGVDDTDFTEQATTILRDLGFALHDEKTVAVPVWRSPSDCTWEADIVEEIARMYGYDQIPEADYQDTVNFVPFPDRINTQRTIEEHLTGSCQFDQIETYPWIDQKRLDRGNLPTENLFVMSNPLSPEQTHLRATMIRSIVEVLAKNAPFFDDLRLFDIGETWDKERNRAEHTCLAGGIWHKETTDRSTSPYLEIKGYRESLLERLGYHQRSREPTQADYFHPRQQAELRIDGSVVGRIASLHPYRAEKAKLPNEPAFAVGELDLTVLTRQEPTTQDLLDQYETLQDQIVRRDLNFVIDADQNYAVVTEALDQIEEITTVDLFDLYGGDNLPEKKKSIALRIKIKGDGSMKTKQINTVMDKAIKAVEDAGGTLRT